MHARRRAVAMRQGGFHEKAFRQGVLPVQRQLALVFFAGLFCTVLISWLYIQRPVFLKTLDFKLYDLLLRSTHTTETTGVPVIVDLDERSLAMYGQWPWPRYRVALLMAKIREAGALAVGLDMVFAEEDRTSPKVLQSVLKRDLHVDMGFTGMPRALMDNDQVLAGVLGQGPFVLGFYLNFDEGHEASPGCVLHPVSLIEKRAKGAPESAKFLVNAPSVVCNIPSLAKAATMSGFFNTNPDLDGIYRKTPLFAKYQDKLYPSLSMATLMTAIGAHQAVVKVSPEGIETVRVGSYVIPVDEKGPDLHQIQGTPRQLHLHLGLQGHERQAQSRGTQGQDRLPGHRGGGAQGPSGHAPSILCCPASRSTPRWWTTSWPRTSSIARPGRRGWSSWCCCSRVSWPRCC